MCVCVCVWPRLGHPQQQDCPLTCPCGLACHHTWHFCALSFALCLFAACLEHALPPWPFTLCLCLPALPITFLPHICITMPWKLPADHLCLPSPSMPHLAFAFLPLSSSQTFSHLPCSYTMPYHYSYLPPPTYGNILQYLLAGRKEKKMLFGVSCGKDCWRGMCNAIKHCMCGNMAGNYHHTTGFSGQLGWT